MALDHKLAERMALRLWWFRLYRAPIDPEGEEESYLGWLMLRFPEAIDALRKLMIREVFTLTPSIFPPMPISEEQLGQQLDGDGPFKILDKE